VDLDYLRELDALTNLLILVAQADLLTHEQLEGIKHKIAAKLVEAKIKPFTFSEKQDSTTPTFHVYGVSSIPVSGVDRLDASVSMDLAQAQPLATSDLTLLLEQVFCPDGASRLRHCAAKKYIQWCRDGNFRNQQLARHTDQDRYAPKRSRHCSRLPSYPWTSCAELERREDDFAMGYLAKWAVELRRSLAHEQWQHGSA